MPLLEFSKSIELVAVGNGHKGDNVRFADVDKHLVLIDADHLSGDHIALLEGDEGCVVVGDYLTVNFEEQPV